MTNKAEAVPVRSKRSRADAAPDEDVGSPLTAEQARLALSGRIEPVRPTTLYRLWIALVAAVMVLLPLIYVAIIGLVVAGLVYHAKHHVTVFQSFGRGRHALQAALAVYVGPLVIGSVVVLFMLKPFFARPARREKLRVLDRGSEPLLHALVDGLCAAVGSPRPSRIEVNCDVNASAHREGPFLGIFGSRLVLTIGMPLAAGLILKQFTGVLAHEFGHFSQGAGMRLCTLIRTINMWFARVVYERDAWDQRLEALSEYNYAYVKILGGLTRLAVWLTRRVLWVLMWVGHLVSSFLSRQMEFDADRYAARLVGGAVFAATSWQLRVMSVAQNGAYHDLGTSWNERRLPDDFSKLVLANVPQLPGEMIESMRADVEKSTSGWFESHPCDRDRIARAMLEAPGDGIFRLDGPASAVFSDMDELSRSVSFDYYRSIVDAGLRKDQVFSVAELLESQAGDQVGQEAAERYFLGPLNLITLRLDLPAGHSAFRSDRAVSAEALVQARDKLQTARTAWLDASQRIDGAVRGLRSLQYATIAHGAGLKFNLASFGFGSLKPNEVKGARDAIIEEMNQWDQACSPFGAAAAERLGLALAALRDDARVEEIPEGHSRRAEAVALYSCLAHLARVCPPSVRSLLWSRSILSFLVEAIRHGENSQNKLLMESFRQACNDVATDLRKFRAELGEEIKYPFEHADPDMTLGKFMLGRDLPFRDDPAGLLDAAELAVKRVTDMYSRVLGCIAETAALVEESFGLSAIELPSTQPASN